MTSSDEPMPEVMGDRSAFLAMAGQHYENFPVGSFLMPREARPHIRRIYAFARTADDIADELGDAEMLEAYRLSFAAHLTGAAERPVPLFVDLARTIAELALPPKLFFDLLDAFARDLDKQRYANEAELFDYCRRSADPVGRLVLRVCGHDDRRLDQLSDRICTGLQLLNHLQDIGPDLRDRDRLYFPTDDLRRFGVDEEQCRASSASPELRALVGYWLDRTVGMFREGWPLTEAVGGRLRLELRAIIRGAAAVAVAIRAEDCDVLSRHIRLGKLRRLGTVTAAICTSKPPEVLR